MPLPSTTGTGRIDQPGSSSPDQSHQSRTATGFGKNGTNHWAWYKRNIRVPNSMRGQRIKIRFTMVKYKTFVYWNGEKVGEHLDGTIPFEIDITDKVKFNSENKHNDTFDLQNQ